MGTALIVTTGHFAGAYPPAAVFFYSPDRAGEYPQQHLAEYSGILQADAYGGFEALYQPRRKPGPITEAACWAHARRKLFELADVSSKGARQDQDRDLTDRLCGRAEVRRRVRGGTIRP
jgi:hypothetical protein